MIRRITFTQVKITQEKTVRCRKCGKRLVRQKTFWQTINPYNKNAEGYIKTRQEIICELKETANLWREKAESCNDCN